MYDYYYGRDVMCNPLELMLRFAWGLGPMCVTASLVGLLHLIRLPVLHVYRHGGGAIWSRDF